MPQQILQVDQAMLETALNLVSRAVSSCTMSGQILVVVATPEV